MSFCKEADQCKNKDTCYRYFSPEEAQKAHAWMKNPPVSFSSFAEYCDKYEPIK
jgi:hypothetical protein